MSTLYPSEPSFKLRKEVKTDRIKVAQIDTVTYELPFTFTGPHTVTVMGSYTQSPGGSTINIPKFSGTAVGSVAVFTAVLPEWVPVPHESVAIGVPVTNAAATAAGYITIADTGIVNVYNYTGAYTTTCGLPHDAVLHYTH